MVKGALAVDCRKTWPGGKSVSGRFSMPLDRFCVTALFGASGSGKSTLLRCLAGLELPDQGEITAGDDLWFRAAPRCSASPQERNIGFVAQSGALFPHLTVLQNVRFGLASADFASGDDLVERMGLAALRDRRPATLSGGERQRAALARALVRRPRLLLLDEPFASLDAPARQELRAVWREWLSAAGTPTILVTHDRDEMLGLADRLVLLDAGETLQSGPLEEVFERPASPAAARILGVDRLLPGRAAPLPGDDGLLRVKIGEGELTAVAAAPYCERVWVCVRPEDVLLQTVPPAASSARNVLPCRIAELLPRGATVLVRLAGAVPLEALVTRAAASALHLQVGDAVWAQLKATSIHLIPRGK